MLQVCSPDTSGNKLFADSRSDTLHRIMRRFLLIIMILMAVSVAYASRSASSHSAFSGMETERMHENSGVGEFERKTREVSNKDLAAKAWIHIKNECYDSAAMYYSVVASRYSPSLSAADKRLCAIASANIGYIWVLWRQNAAEAYPWLEKGWKISRENGLADVETGIMSNLGQIYFDYNNLDKAVKFLGEAFNGVLANRDDRYFSWSLIDYATALVADDRKDSIAPLLDKASEYNLGSDMPLAQYSKGLVSALRDYERGDCERAALAMRRTYPSLNLETDRNRYQAQHLFIEARMWREAGNFKEAAKALRRMVAIAGASGYYSLKVKGYDDLEKCYRLQGNADSASFYRLRALTIRDSLYSATRYDAVQDFETKSRLNALNENVKEVSQKAERQRRLTWLISIGALLAAAIAVWLYISHRRLNKAYHEIFKRNVELYDLSLNNKDKGEKRAAPAPTQKFELEKGRELLRRIIQFMEESREIYNCDFTVEKLAESLDSKPKIISQTINQLTGKNFNTMLGEYRIKEACRLLSDPEQLKQRTMESIAESVGYKSRTYFSRVFKTVMGLTPSQFIKQAEKFV